LTFVTIFVILLCMENRTFNPIPLWVARRRKKLKQKDAAVLLEKCRLSVIRMEQGRRDEVSDDLIIRYAELLGVPVDEVFPPESEPSKIFA
jgi:DNA-binding XRE family transcriptional regulator